MEFKVIPKEMLDLDVEAVIRHHHRIRLSASHCSPSWIAALALFQKFGN